MINPISVARVKTSGGDVKIEWLFEQDELVLRFSSRGSGDCLLVNGQKIWFQVCTRDGDSWSVIPGGQGGEQAIDFGDGIFIVSGNSVSLETIEETRKILRGIAAGVLQSHESDRAKIVYWIRKHHDAKWRKNINERRLEDRGVAFGQEEKLSGEIAADERIIKGAKNKIFEIIKEKDGALANILAHPDKAVRTFMIGILGELKALKKSVAR